VHAPPFEIETNQGNRYSLKKVVSAFAVVTAGFQATVFESGGLNRMGKGRSGRVSPAAPYRRERIGGRP